MRTELVYLIQAGPYYKIGRTRDLKKRLAAIQTNCPWELSVVHMWETITSVLVERELHRRFTKIRMWGEWFGLTDKDVNTLQTIHDWRPEELVRLKVHGLGYGNQKTKNSPIAQLFTKYKLRQVHLTRALQNHPKKISRSYSHYLWHGLKPLSLNAAIAIRQAYPDKISEQEIFAVLEESRRPPDRPAPPMP